jgi:glycosyltransferase involved in cell wall biosynthesis
MRIALVEPYHGGSHAAWADGYRDHSAHEVRLITHPARFWKWRMHGSFLTLAELLAEDVARHGQPDVLVVSSMTDVAALAGAIRNIAPGIPIVTYFHESQFTYPLSPLDTPDATYAMKNWASASVADLVIFNSSFHRELFGSEAKRFLSGFPDLPHTAKVDDVIGRSIVLPVGVDATPIAVREVRRDGPPLVLWNHRWEHDKGPDELGEIVRGLIDADVDFAMAMCGEVFVSIPPRFAAVVADLGNRLIHQGWAARERYVDLLASASVVLSTSLQEFFGIGVIEGVAGGAHPILPNRLVYPERVRELDIDSSVVLYDAPTEAVALTIDAMAMPVDEDLRSRAIRYDWSVVAPMYDDALAAVAADGSFRA